MTLKPGLTIMKTIKELQDFYDENLSNRELLTTKWIVFGAKTSLYLLIGGLCMMFISIFINLPIVLGISLLAMITGFIIIYFTLRASRKYVTDRFSEYQEFVGNAPEFEENILFAYRVDEFDKEVKRKNISPTYLKNIIDYLDTKSEKIKNKKWFPYSVMAVCLFPLWSEYVGIKMDDKLITLITLSFLGVSLGYGVIIVNNVLKSFIWSEALRYDQLSDILKVVVSSENLRLGGDNQN